MQRHPSLAAGMLGGLDYLRAYPYDCTEQTVSRFLPNVMTFRALQELGIENPGSGSSWAYDVSTSLEQLRRLGVPNPELKATLPYYVSVGLQRLYKLQHFDGGWGRWLSDTSDPYITAYVLLGLSEAQGAGFPVDEYTMQRASQFLTDFLDQPADVESPHSLDTRAFIIYVLAEHGEGDLSRAAALYQRRDALQSYGKAYLATAMRLLAPENDSRARNLVNSLSSEAITSATGAHWKRSGRTTGR